MSNRRRQSSNPALNLSPDPSAATAAVQAFLSSRAYSQSLSSSAAAAALRAHTTSPKPVSEVQTKRTLRRQASTSSNGSVCGSLRGLDGRALLGRTRSGSMTKRTFRDASPIRDIGRGRGRGAPPVPALPDTSPHPVASQGAASLEPARVGSHSSRRAAGRGVSLDRAEGQTSHAARASNLALVAERDLDHDSGSVNFSYPIKGPNSPKVVPTGGTRLTSGRRPGSPQAGESIAIRGPGSEEVANIQYSVREAADRPVKKKKKAVAKEVVQGSHLVDGTTGGRPRGTAVDNANYDNINGNYQPRTVKQDETLAPDTATASAATTTPRKKRKKKKIVPPAEEHRESQESNMQYPPPTASHSSGLNSIPQIAENTQRDQRSRKARVGGQLAKRPSIVREDQQHEEREEQGGGKGLESSQRSPGDPHHALEASDSGWEAPSAENRRGLEDYSGYPSLVRRPPALTMATSPSKGLELSLHPNGIGSARGYRHPSLSPSRTARFSTTPLLSTDTGRVKHEPPPRAVSPAKSAMKPSPSPRTGSPVGSIEKGQGQRPSEASDENSVRSVDGEAGNARTTPKGKKKARVSFDEEPVVVGRAATPPMSPNSPNEKRGWYSGARGREVNDEEVSDKGIKPVPALPAFDSVRARRKHSNEDEDIEKVTENVPGVPSATGSGSSTGNQAGASSDMALAHDLASKEAPAPSSSGRVEPRLDQPSLRQADPFPPLVTSVEGTGWASDSEVSVRDDDSIEAYVPVESRSGDPSRRAAYGKTPPGRGRSETSYAKTNGTNGGVAQLVLVEPTPTLEETVDREEWLNIPGSFPTGAKTETPEEQDVKDIAEHHATDLTPASLGISEPEPEEAAAHHRTGSPTVGEFAACLGSHTHARYEDESGSSGDSIYSDAAEDLSDLEGDGFGSIDAVVESPPTVDTVARLPTTSSIQSPATIGPRVAAPQISRTSKRRTEYHTESSSDVGRDMVQLHQQGLSAQKKRQMEGAAVVHAPSEVVTIDTRKPSTKKSQSTRGPPNVDRWTESESGYPPDSPTIDRKSQASGEDPVAIASMGPGRGPVTGSGSGNRLRRPMGDNPTRTSARAQPANPPSANATHHLEAQHPKVLLQKRHIRKSAPVPAAPSPMPTPSSTHHRIMSESAAPAPPPAVPSSSQKTGKISVLRRRLPNESDSDSGSSFKRRPRATSGVPGSHMRRTMRDPPPEPEASSTVASGDRPLSPSVSGERRPFSHGSTMRTTMRDSSARTSSLRSNSPERTKSPISLRRFGKSSKQKAASLKGVRSGFARRFSGSAKPAFRSRFADSSGEDEGASIPLTPVRGIPKRPGVESRESTELSDSSDSEDDVVTRSPPPTKTKSFQEGNGLALSRLRHSGSGRDLSTSVLHAESSKPDQKTDKKRFTFGVLGHHKKDTLSKVRKSEIESAARRDTSLERSKFELQASKAAASSPNGRSSAVGGRKKKVFRHFGADSWPLRGYHHKGDAEGAAVVDDGAAAQQGSRSEGDKEEASEAGGGGGSLNMRPEEGEGEGNANVGESEGGKSVVRKGWRRRKKFPFLRKVFGLDEQ